MDCVVATLTERLQEAGGGFILITLFSPDANSRSLGLVLFSNASCRTALSDTGSTVSYLFLAGACSAF